MDGLGTLLEQDGIELKGPGPEYEIRCFLPGHDDSSPSCSVNTIKGRFYCHACDKGGTAFHYLIEKRGMARRDAMAYLKHQGWTDENINRSQERPVQPPPVLRDIPDSAFLKGSSVKGKKVAEFPYLDGSGRVRMIIARYEGEVDEKRKKTFLAFTPKEEGGVWAAFPNHAGIPEYDSCFRRPLYRLADVLESVEKTPDRRIWFVEGEKCVESVRASVMTEGRSPPACTTCPKSNLELTDFSPLAGREVALISDRDEVGRKWMQKVAPFIHKAGAVVIVVEAAGDDGYDVANVLEANDHQFRAAMNWVKEQPNYKWPPPGLLPAPASSDTLEEGDVPAEAQTIELGNTPYFRMLGRGAGTVLFHLKETNEIVEMRQSSLAAMSELNRLADLDWWREESGNDVTTKTGVLKIQNRLIRASEKLGIVDWRQQSIGLGAFRTKAGQLFFNAGDRLFIESEEGRLDREVSFWDYDDQIFLPGPHIPLRMTSPRETEALRRAFAIAVMSYRWKNVQSGVTFLGWIVSSIIGGALSQRPAVWLSGNADTGKTWLLTQTIGRLCGQHCRIFMDPSVPGLIGSVRNGALPVCIDEAEPRPGKTGEQRWNDLLQLFRSSTSGENIVRPRHGIDNFPMRFSTMFSSIYWPRMSMADWSRFYPLELSAIGIDDWPKVRNAITDSLAGDKALLIYSAIVSAIPEILKRAAELHEVLLKPMGSSREAHMASILSSGYQFLSGEVGYIPRRDEQDKRAPSGYEAIERLLGTMIPSHGNHPVPLLECLTSYESPEDMDRAARYGIKMDEAGGLMIAFVPTLENLVRQSNLGNIDLRQLVRSLEDVEYDKKNQRQFGPFRAQRFYYFPAQVVEERFGMLRRNRKDLPDEQ